jgi:hypothetical protein
VTTPLVVAWEQCSLLGSWNDELSHIADLRIQAQEGDWKYWESNGELGDSL